ncbi:MAG: ABC transporter ATP-binding protein/permease [Chloroflexota bacterium]|nr:ABC transporter ATP-binding protein/permease [Chloroflexota bacterium]
MSIVQGLTAEKYDRDYSDRELVRRIWHYFAPWKGRLAIIIVMLFLRSVFGAAAPVLVAQGVDWMVQSGADWWIPLLIGAVLLVGVLVWVTNWLQRRLAARLIGDVVMQMRQDAFRSAIQHDMSFYDEYQSGRIVSRITTDTDEFGRVAILVVDVGSQLLLALLLLGILVTIEWRLTLLVLLMAPVAFGVAWAFRGIARRVTQRSQRAVAEVNVSIQEVVTGISVAKNFRREQGIYEEFSEVNETSYATNVRRGLVLSTLFPTLSIFSGLGTALLLYYGGVSVADGVVSAGDWFLFITSIDRFWFPMINLASFWSQFQAGLSATERVFALMDAQPMVQQVDSRAVEELAGDIRFDDVCFAYEDDEWVLEDFDLHIRPGESVALVGHTGAGKSSIAKLVTRFYEFQAGRLLVDGQDIRTFDLEDYRLQLGVVSQVPFLFDGTVADNIRYAYPSMSDEAVAGVAQQLGSDWLDALPNGLQTDVGERGGRLSLGQRQLVVLARVLAQDPAIFILDEATASIDPFTEAQIQQALERLFEDRTSIIIAHRLSTVKAADRILVLQEGRIIEEGNHDQLMAQGGHYAELYNTYFRHQSLEYIEERGRERERRIA